MSGDGIQDDRLYRANWGVRLWRISEVTKGELLPSRFFGVLHEHSVMWTPVPGISTRLKA